MTVIHDRAERRGGNIFILILVLLTLGIVAGGSYSYRNIKRNSRAEVERELNAIADLKVNELARYRQERLGDGAVFYKNVAFSALVRRHFEHPNDLEAQDQLRAWLGHIQAAFQYDRVMLLDPQYSKKMIVPDGPEQSTSFVSPTSSEGLRSGKIVFEDFYWNDVNQRIYLKILVPVLDEAHNDRVIGILALRIDPETHLYPYINRWPAPSRTAETQIIRRDGNDALYLNELKFQKNAALHLRIPLGSKDVSAVKAVLGQEGIVEGVDYRGVPVVAALRPIPDSPWFLVAKIDTSEAFKPMRARLLEIVVMVAILLLGTGAVVGYFWRRQSALFYQGRYQATDALRESEERFKLIFDNAVDGILLMSLENQKIDSANKSMSQMLGYSLEELKKLGAADIHPREALPYVREQIEIQSKDGLAPARDLPMLRKDGSVFYANVRGALIVLSGKKYLMGVFRDITEQKRAEEALRESEEQFRVMSAAAQDAIIMMDNDGLITFWSEAAGRIFGHARNEAVGKSTHDLLTPAVYLKKFQKVFPQWRETGQGAAVGKTVELIALRKDGTEFPVEISLSSPRLKGRWNAIAIIRDITERKRAEEELTLRNVLLSTQQEVSLDGILVVDEKGQILSFNQHFVEMWGIPAEVIATKSDELALKAVLDKLVEPLEFIERVNYLYEHRRETSQDEIALKDGRTFDRYSAPMFGSDERYYGRVWYFRDITVRKRAVEESRKANEKLGSALNKLKERSLQNSVLSEMREFLQASSTIDEIGPVILRSMKKLFPDSEGALFLLSPSKTDLESAVRWGDFPEDVDNNVFSPDACWGLRRGSVYVVDDIKSGLICPHLKNPPATAYACLPLMAKGDVLGLLHIRGRSTGKGEDSLRVISDLKDLTTTLSELLSLSISNIRLRETLSIQSIKDPLTGLFNRRYMEENFQREIYRAARKQDHIGVIMVDIDHFKKFNDVYGHAAGDVVLVELADFFKLRIRGADIACRYGGEEFAFILPESSLENTVKRANQMIEEARALRVQYAGQALGPTTLSMGVAAYPIHGAKPEDLLRAADAALYRAKKEGRNRVVTA